MQTNSASGTGNLASKYSFPPLPRCFEEFSPSCDAERISCLCLQNGAVSYEDFESLISVLPPDHELGSAGSESKTFTTGAYVYSCRAGLRSNVCKFPATTKLLASILSCLFPARHFTSAGLFRQLRAPPHVDTNNQPGCPNLLVPASHFENGAVWVEGPGDHEFFVNGQKRFGTLLDVANGPCELDAQRLHATCNWTGTRLILVGFCVANCATLEPGLAARLDVLGFLLPDAQLRKKMRVHASTAHGSPANEVSLTPIGFSPAHSPHDADAPVLRRPTPPIGSSPLGYPGPKPHTGLTSCDRAPSSSEPQPAQTEPARLPVWESQRDSNVQRLFPDVVAPMVIEVFAGTARLSQACQAAGFRTLAIDKSSGRSKFAIHRLDLTQVADLQALLDIITLEADHLELVHLAPPCGTSSAARNKPIPHAVSRGIPVPKPLRSTAEPQGLSTLVGVDLLRVQQANALYAAVGDIVRHCVALRVRVTVENPANSLAWLCDGMDDLFRMRLGTECIFDHCSHGGRRDKTTLWWCSDDTFLPLSIRCTKDHTHEPWQPVFRDGLWHYPTAEEAAYPWLLCQRVAALLLDASTGMVNCSPLVRPPEQVALERQPRYAKPLVSAFRGHDAWAVPLNNDLAINAVLACYPKGSKVLKRKLMPWGLVRVCVPTKFPLLNTTSLAEKFGAFRMVRDTQGLSHDGGQELPGDEGACNVAGEVPPKDLCAEHAEVVQIGIPREPEDFIKEAVRAGHPRDMLSFHKKGHAQRVAKSVLLSFSEREAKSTQALEKWKSQAEELKGANANLMQQKPAYIQRVLGEKNVLLWQFILQDNAFPDQRLWEDLHQGFRISGWMPDTGIFTRRLKPPTSCLKELLSQSSYRTPLTLRSIARSPVDEVAKQAWAETKIEEEKQWIFRDHAYNPSQILLARRFGLAQKSKVRVIDDGKGCSLNTTVGLCEKYNLDGIDVLAATLLLVMAQASGKPLQLRGKTFDLVSAYKHFPIHPEDREHFRIGVLDTDQSEPAVFGSNVLTFGATGSVGGFLRVSNAIWHTGVHDLEIPWLSYFDDFPVLSPAACCDQVDSLVDKLFSCLHVEYAKTGKKAVEFNCRFAALGLMCDLSGFDEGSFTIGHTVERRTELVATIHAILDSDELTPKEAEVLRGRLHWFNSYLFGRAPCNAMHTLSKRAQGHTHDSRLGEDLRASLSILLNHLETSPPLTLRLTSGRNLFVFTDGSYEPDSDIRAGVGGLIVDDAGVPLRFFSDHLCDTDLEVLLQESSHPIYAVELFAVMIAMSVWEDLLFDTFTVVFVDNTAAQAALIAGRSSTECGRVILQHVIDSEHRTANRPWFGWVPSYSNPSDPPSRGVYEHLERQGASRTDVSSFRGFLAAHNRRGDEAGAS